jgi:hypothetical protein
MRESLSNARVKRARFPKGVNIDHDTAMSRVLQTFWTQPIDHKNFIKRTSTSRLRKGRTLASVISYFRKHARAILDQFLFSKKSVTT